MLAKILKAFESDLPESQTIGAIINTVNMPNARMLFEHHYLGPIEAGDIEPSEAATRIATLEAQAAADAEDNALQTERIAALEAQVAALAKSSKKTG